MRALEDLTDRPRIEDPWDLRDPEMGSFHEAVCDLARHMAKYPWQYEGLPLSVADHLNDINESVVALFRLVIGSSNDRAT